MYGGEERKTLWLLALTVTVLFWAALAVQARSLPKQPELASNVFVLREEIIQTFERGSALRVEYAIDGKVQSAIFYQEDEELRLRFMAYLRSIGGLYR